LGSAPAILLVSNVHYILPILLVKLVVQVIETSLLWLQLWNPQPLCQQSSSASSSP